MKILVLLFAALLVAGCGEKSSSEGSESVSEKPTAPSVSAEPSADTAKPSDNSVTLPLSDADVERLVKEAVEFDSLEERDGLRYQLNESEPYSGWTKIMYDSGQVQGLGQLKDGKMTGLMTAWYENGQKQAERTYKDGELDGLTMFWHENGQKKGELTHKDGELVSKKFWTITGEEVETVVEAIFK